MGDMWRERVDSNAEISNLTQSMGENLKIPTPITVWDIGVGQTDRQSFVEGGGDEKI